MSSVVIHPQYYPPGVFYDLALLQLDASADITKNNIGLECIPDSRGESYVVDQCVVIGWGKETFGASGISAILKKIQVRSLKRSFFLPCTMSGSSGGSPCMPVSASEPETRIQVKLSNDQTALSKMSNKVPPSRVIPLCRGSGWQGCVHWGWRRTSDVSPGLGSQQVSDIVLKVNKK